MLKEDHPLGVHSLSNDFGFYSFSKVSTEATISHVGRRLGVPIAILRMGSPYGPAGGTVVERLEKMMRGDEILLHPKRPNLFRPDE